MADNLDMGGTLTYDDWRKRNNLHAATQREYDDWLQRFLPVKEDIIP